MQSELKPDIYDRYAIKPLSYLEGFDWSYYRRTGFLKLKQELIHARSPNVPISTLQIWEKTHRRIKFMDVANILLNKENNDELIFPLYYKENMMLVREIVAKEIATLALGYRSHLLPDNYEYKTTLEDIKELAQGGGFLNGLAMGASILALATEKEARKMELAREQDMICKVASAILIPIPAIHYLRREIMKNFDDLNSQKYREFFQVSQGMLNYHWTRLGAKFDSEYVF